MLVPLKVNIYKQASRGTSTSDRRKGRGVLVEKRTWARLCVDSARSSPSRHRPSSQNCSNGQNEPLLPLHAESTGQVAGNKAVFHTFFGTRCEDSIALSTLWSSRITGYYVLHGTCSSDGRTCDSHHAASMSAVLVLLWWSIPAISSVNEHLRLYSTWTSIW